jgi:hypothetical protein
MRLLAAEEIFSNRFEENAQDSEKQKRSDTPFWASLPCPVGYSDMTGAVLFLSCCYGVSLRGSPSSFDPWRYRFFFLSELEGLSPLQGYIN